MDLRSEQLKDTYGNLVTTGTTAGSPTSGGLQNGQGTLLTSVGIGTDSPQTILNGFSSSARGIAIENAYPIIAFSDTADASYKSYIGTDSSELYLWNAANGPIVFATNSTERMRIDSGGDISFRDGSNNEAFYWDVSEARLGLGTTSPSKGLHLTFSNDNASIRFENTASAKVWDLTPANPNVSNSGFSLHNVTDNTVPFHVTNGGNVGIGTSSPTEKLAVQSAFTTSASDVFLEINSGHQASGGSDVTGEAGVLFKQGGSGDVLRNAGAIISGREGNYSVDSVADSYLAFETALNGTNTERMRITSDGYVGIGTGDTDVQSGDLIGVLAFNSKDISTNSSGAIGSIRSYATAAFNTGAVSGDLRFYTQNNAAPNGSLLSGTERMRILSGGGITFNGDTATANALDDYEEGTWTATVGGTSNLTSVTEVQNKYTKIGNVVHLNISWTADITSSTAETQIVFALPFATSDSHNDVGVVSVLSGSGADRFGVGATFRGTTSTTNVYVIIGGNQINATGSATIKTSFTYIIE